MMRVLTAAALVLIASSGAALAAPCKDPKTGKFMKCPEPAKPMRCKTANGKFAKCGPPGAKPV